MYSELHTILRKTVNATTIDYNGRSLPKYWQLDEQPENGPHIVVSRELTEPDPQEIGDNAQDLTGFLQFLVKLPATGQALDAQLSLIDAQLWNQFPLDDYDDGNFKIWYNNVSTGNHIRVDGFVSTTVRINFTAMYCNRG